MTLRLAALALAVGAVAHALVPLGSVSIGFLWAVEALGVVVLLAVARAPWPVWCAPIAVPLLVSSYTTSFPMLMVAAAVLVLRDGVLLGLVRRATPVPAAVMGLAVLARAVDVVLLWVSVELDTPSPELSEQLGQVAGLAMAVTWLAVAALGPRATADFEPTPAGASGTNALAATLAGTWIALWAASHALPWMMRGSHPSLSVFETSVGVAVAVLAGFRGVRGSRLGLVATVALGVVLAVRAFGLPQAIWVAELRLVIEGLLGLVAVGAVWLWLFWSSLTQTQRLGAYGSVAMFLLYLPALVVVMSLQRPSVSILPSVLWGLQDQLTLLAVVLPSIWGLWGATFVADAGAGAPVEA